MKKTGKETLRMCCGCREQKLKMEMTRLYLDSENSLRVDRTGKSGGRGVYVCKNTDCIEKALKTGAVGRGLKSTLSTEQIKAARQLLMNEMSGQDCTPQKN